LHITRLRLLGFKSFVEPAELVVERGLTGVVGPNGCGKSNLLEALRWVMGETSYKSMRASSMEDVIFSGTNARPARNIAEVTIALDNRDRKAHPAFNDEDNLEITRRIERDSGSEYRINGKPVRARDVQLLFADASTGAHSPALVQQGRIGEIVSAKPAQRRFILEEAAGITGLHSRRHEAEIKLRGAENNLERLQDIIGQMDNRLSGLKRQERQVKRYRDVSRQIERLQILLYYCDWITYQATVRETEQKHQDILLVVGEKTRAEAKIRQTQIKAASRLPKLREQEMVAAAIVQRLNIESEHLEGEQQAQQKRKNELIARRTQINADLQREEQSCQEDRQRLKSFRDELVELERTTSDNGQTRKQATQQVQDIQLKLSDAEQEFLVLSNQYAEQKAQRNALQREQLEKRHSIKAIQQKHHKLDHEHSLTEQQLSQIADFDELGKQIEQQSAHLHDLEKKLQTGEKAIEKARTDESACLREQMEARSRLFTLKSEIKTLEKLLKSPTRSDDGPILEEIIVTPGYETALGAALGDDLDASLNARAELYWRDFADSPEHTPLPEGTIPLIQLVTAPNVLLRRLKMIGIVEPSEGDDLQKQLSPGQRLVSVEGDLWRWDGFIARANAPTNAARRLAEKNRLEKLQNHLVEHQLASEIASKNADQAHNKRSRLEIIRKDQKHRLKKLRSKLEHTRQSQARAEHRAFAHKARLEAISATRAELIERRDLETTRLEEIKSKLAELNNLRALETLVERHTRAITTLRTNYHKAKAHEDELQLAERNRCERLGHLKDGIAHSKARLDQSLGQMKTLEARLGNDRQELAELGDLPEQTLAKRQTLDQELVKAKKQRSEAADELQRAENTLREIELSLQLSQTDSVKAREQRAACKARLDAANTRLAEQKQLIAAELDCPPEKCPQKAGLEKGEKLPERHVLERRLAKLTKDRERLGNVNLRADVEARELSAQIKEMSAEHQDLIEAIDTLRTAINGLNREGRRRLMSAFEEINNHFEALFTSLFGGGKARLELIESDDPLQAGLEIIASPPGKKPQILTLLSGGEKALTALSLIFAVFLTNPAPICVLDEVDAPLDDANVERFCTLLNEMTQKTDTRFLVITHHPTTMSHMDRLFGVTMAEKGISQMVSVDLSTAERYRQSA
jgi:chromosome segregation protein